jgi:hypothetical protein
LLTLHLRYQLILLPHLHTKISDTIRLQAILSIYSFKSLAPKRVEKENARYSRTGNTPISPTVSSFDMTFSSAFLIAAPSTSPSRYGSLAVSGTIFCHRDDLPESTKVVVLVYFIRSLKREQLAEGIIDCTREYKADSRSARFQARQGVHTWETKVIYPLQTQRDRDRRDSGQESGKERCNPTSPSDRCSPIDAFPVEVNRTRIAYILERQILSNLRGLTKELNFTLPLRTRR